MGLASYGKPKFYDLILENLIDVKNEGSIHLDMEYFGFIDCITFLETGCVADVELLVEFLIGVIYANIAHSQLRELDIKAFMAKYHTVREKINASPYVDHSALHYGKIEKIINEMPGGKIPLGRCHGDLTLSNILVKPAEKRFGVIDFSSLFLRRDTVICFLLEVAWYLSPYWPVPEYSSLPNRLNTSLNKSLTSASCFTKCVMSFILYKYQSERL